MTTVYFSCSADSRPEAVDRWDWELRPLAVLVAFPHLDWWAKNTQRYRVPRALMLDSGAFTAMQTGRPVDIDALIAEARDPRWTEVAALDVIGDADATRRNVEYMWSHGCPRAVPTFHLGESWDLLAYYASRAAKVALGGMVGASSKLVMRFVEQCFARVWPKRLHSFGRCEDDLLQRFPFHSGDTASWIMGPIFRRQVVNRGGRATTTALSVDGRENILHMMRSHMEVLYRREQSLIRKWGATLARLETGASHAPIISDPLGELPDGEVVAVDDRGIVMRNPAAKSYSEDV